MACDTYRGQHSTGKEKALDKGKHFTEADPKVQEVSNFLRSTQLTELREKSELPCLHSY